MKFRSEPESSPQNGLDWHDLTQWQCREFGLVAGEQDPLALLVAQATEHQAMAALAAIAAGW